MIIKSLTLANFRQYKGTHEIVFSTDKEKNVTVVIGKNTSGKTTLVQSFLWCLYGECSFKTKEVLNVEVRNELYGPVGASVIVKIVLVHEDIEYVISRQQDFSVSENGAIKSTQAVMSIKHIDPKTGNAIPTYYRDNENIINQILPHDLSDYFFFDGERVSGISEKKNVVDAVRGLMNINVVNAGVEHLDPNKQRSAIGKLRKDFDLKGKETADNLKMLISTLEDKKSKAQEALEQIDNEIEFYTKERADIQEKLDACKDVKELQNNKKHLESKITMIENRIKELRKKLVDQFNSNYYSFLAKPLFNKGVEILKSAKHDMRGIPEMDEKSIDFILERGRCICGRLLKDDPEALQAIEHERSLLPPHEIGSTIRKVVESAELLLSIETDLGEQNKQVFKEICKAEIDLEDARIELNETIEKIKKVGDANVAEMEADRQKAQSFLMKLNQDKGAKTAEINNCTSSIVELNKEINSLVVRNAKNELIEREIQYAMAIYKWFKDDYDRLIVEVKEQLTDRINQIFSKMYHGTRIFELDDNYRIQLLVPVGNNKFKTDESKGLEAVKNFSFICGLMAVACEKANSKKSSDQLEAVQAIEPYPIVMDAPFSNADETHIETISNVLPTVADQVILFAMQKDWDYAKSTMGDKVGAYYAIEKVNNSDTHSIIRRI